MNKKILFILTASILTLALLLFFAAMGWDYFTNQKVDYNISYTNVNVDIDNINNLLYVTDKGSNKINIYDLNTLKLSDSIILDEAPKDVLRLYIDENENVALLNGKFMNQFKILDLNKKSIRCEVEVGQSDVGWIDVKNKQFIQISTNQFILYDYNCKQKNSITKNGTIISKVSEGGHIGILREKDLQMNLLDLANGNIIDSFSIYNGSSTIPQHNLLLSNDWFVANFNREPKTDIVFYNRHTKEISWIHLQETIAQALKQVYLVNDLYFLGTKENDKNIIVIIDLKNKKVLNKITADNDTVAYAVDSKGENIFLLNKLGKIEKKPVTSNGGDSNVTKPLNFGAMLHLEGQLRIPDKAGYFRVNSDLKQIIDLFSKYDAKITIESEMPYVEAADKWGNNLMLYALENGHGIGTHCDFDSMSQEKATTNYKSRKEKIDAVVGAENNLGCSGGWGTHDWAQAAYKAGFSYLDGPVMIAYLAVPEENRPINPDTGKHYADNEISPGLLYYHDPIPPEIEDRIYLRRLKDTNDLIGDNSGIVLISGSLGEISSLSEGRSSCFPGCELTNDDIDYIFKNIDYVNSIKNESKVSSLYLHFPISAINMPLSKKEENLKIIEDWLEQMQEYQNQGKIKWKTMKEVYEEYNKKEPLTTGQTQPPTNGITQGI